VGELTPTVTNNGNSPAYLAAQSLEDRQMWPGSTLFKLVGGLLVCLLVSPEAVAAKAKAPAGFKHAKYNIILRNTLKHWPDCSASQIRSTVPGHGQILMEGCGKTVHWGADLDQTFWFHDFGVRDRAPVDLACPGEAITVTFVDEKTPSVAGCGQQAVYVEGYGRWVINGPIRAQQTD